MATIYLKCVIYRILSAVGGTVHTKRNRIKTCKELLFPLYVYYSVQNGWQYLITFSEAMRITRI